MQRMTPRPVAESGLNLAIDELVAFAEQLAALRMADDHVAAAGVLEQQRRNLAGKGAGRFGVAVLGGEQDGAAGQAGGCRLQGGERRGNHHLDAIQPVQLPFSPSTSSLVSALVLCSFQLPAIIGVRMSKSFRMMGEARNRDRVTEMRNY